MRTRTGCNGRCAWNVRRVVGAPVVRWIPLLLLTGALPAAAQPTDLRVVLVDTEGRAPVVGALVRLDGERARLSDDRGRVLWEEVPAGSYTVTVQHAAYEPTRRRIDHPTTTAGAVRIALVPRPFRLEGIEVEGRRPLGSPMERFESRRRLGRGDFILPEVFEEREGWELSEVIARHSGLRRECSGLSCRLSSRRSLGGLGGGSCRVQYFLDGVHFPLPDPRFSLDRFLSTQEVRMVEVYSGPSQTPPEFNRFDARCGVVVIWTRQGPS